jgi:hypothetical protein
MNWHGPLSFLKDQVEKTLRHPVRVPIIVANRGRRILWQTLTAFGVNVSKPPSTSTIKESNPFISSDVTSDVAVLSARYEERRISKFLIGSRNINRQNATVARTARSFFDQTDSLRGAAIEEISSQVSEFRKIYINAPVRWNNNGVHFSTGLFLFLIARRRNPSVIVESGVYKGLSTYFLSAACPNSRLWAFDPDLSELAFRSANATYEVTDWMESGIRCDPLQSSLAFFDDHQCQARRIVEAYSRGIRYLIFDDSWPIEAVAGCGWPPVPTIDMVMNDSLEPNEIVQWIEDGKIWTYVHDEKMRRLCADARALISGAFDVPSLYRETGFAPTSAMKYVELVA